MGERRFTESELGEYDGKEGKPTYVAFNGNVYDLSGSGLWADGVHMGSHTAGSELTRSIESAPHGDEVFSAYPVIGVLVSEPVVEGLGQTLRRLAPHPMIVHFPIAYSLMVPLFSALYLLTGELSFEAASYYLLIIGFLTAPVCSLSGFLSWKVAYKGKTSAAFTRKKLFSLALIVVITVCSVWRTLDPLILVSATGLRYVYLALLMSLIPIITVLGHTGGKIVYP